MSGPGAETGARKKSTGCRIHGFEFWKMPGKNAIRRKGWCTTCRARRSADYYEKYGELQNAKERERRAAAAANNWDPGTKIYNLECIHGHETKLRSPCPTKDEFYWCMRCFDWVNPYSSFA